jgi:hypothetical protein
MAAIANVVVKKTDAVTDVTFTAITGSGAEGSPAVWQNTAGTTVRSNRPTLTMKAKLNGTKAARRTDVQGVFPVVRTINSVETLIGKIPLDFTVPVPEWATDAEVNEAVDQFINLLASAHIRVHVKAGVSPV